MKLLSPLSTVLLCLSMTACAVDATPEDTDQQSSSTTDTTKADDINIPTELSINPIAPRACFIEGFCVANHTEFCVHTGPCAPGQARDLAQRFCNSHCGNINCGLGNILQRANC
jgi:hypothetical protein